MPSNVFNRKFLSVYPSASRTASVNTAALGAVDHNTGPYTGMIVNVNITDITGTAPTVTFTIQGKDEASNTYYTLLASSALNAAGHTVLRVDPRVAASANVAAQASLPRTFRIIATVGGTITTLVYGVSVTLVP